MIASRRPLLAIGPFAFLFGSVPLISAQVVDYSRREMATPGLVVETGYRTGSCDFIRFTPDGKYVYAGGDDKVVRTWKFTGTALETIADDAPPNVPRSILRWPSLRERRGAIFASSLSPDGKLLAIGGWGLRNSQLAVLDRFSGQIRHSVPYLKAARGSTVWAMDFDSTGRRVALGLEDGSIWLWNLDSNQVDRLGQHAAGPGKDRFVFFVQFRSLDTILSADLNGQVLQWSTRGGQPTELFRFQNRAKPVHVIQYAASADRKWLAAAVNGAELVLVKSLPDGGKGYTIKTPSQHFPRALAFDPTGERLAVSVYEVDAEADFQREVSFRVRLYDLKKKRVSDGPKATAKIESLAFHPNGRFLAYSGGNDFEIGVWDTDKDRLVHSQEGKSAGRAVWSVGISADGKVLSYRNTRKTQPDHPNRRGTGTWNHFDLARRVFLGDQPAATPHYGHDQLKGWKVLTRFGTIADADRWFVQGPGMARPLEIPWNWAEDNLPLCWSFVPTPGNKVRLVIGHLWGASLFEVAPDRVRRLRVLHGHDGSVTCLTVSPDCKRLVTGSLDQTIAGWSLEDWNYHPQLGAEFFEKNGRVFVGKVETGSPTWELGLSTGDEIQLLAIGTKPVFNRSSKYAKLGTLGTAEKVMAALRNPTAGVELYFGWRRPEDATPLMEGITNIKDRPIWRFFPTRDREWVLWRWQDYYYDTSTRGDHFIGWVGNAYDERKGYDIGQAPKFYRAEQFRELFHKPDKVAAALADWGKSGVDRESFRVFEPPTVRLTLDRRTAAAKNVVQDDRFSLGIEVAPHSIVKNQQLAKVVLWINDYRHQVWSGEALRRHMAATEIAGQKLEAFRIADLAVPRSLLRSGSNVILVQGFNQADVRGESRALEIVNPLPRKNANLYGLLVGVGNYSKAQPSQIDLVAHEDVAALAGFWKEYRGKLYADADFKVLTERQVTPESLLGHLDQLAGKVRPDDLLIFHLGGHGLNLDMFLEDIRKAVGTKSGIKAADYLRVRQQAAGMGKFVFVCAHFDLWNNLRGTSISLDDLYGKLAQLPCHKVIFLDACHSGAANPADDPRSSTDLIRALTREGVGPIIFSACKPKQSALEIRGAFFKGDLIGGLFAQAILDTLVFNFDQADTNKNGRLEATELDARLRFRIPAWLADMRKSPDPAIRKQAMNLHQDPVAYLPQRERNLAIVERTGKD